MRKSVVAAAVSMGVLVLVISAWPDGVLEPRGPPAEEVPPAQERGLNDIAFTPGIYYANASYQMPINFGVPTGAGGPHVYYTSASMMLRDTRPDNLTAALAEFHWTSSLPEQVPDCMVARFQDDGMPSFDLRQRDDDGVARAWMDLAGWTGRLTASVLVDPDEACAVAEAQPRIVVSMFLDVPPEPEHRMLPAFLPID